MIEIIDNFASPVELNELIHHYDQILEKNLEESGLAREAFTKFKHYDGYHFIPHPHEYSTNDLRLRVYSASVIKELESLYSIPLTMDGSVEFHYRKPGAEKGSVHNDFKAISFVSNPNRDEPLKGLNFWYNLRTKRNTLPRRRAIGNILYLNEGEDGETRFYDASKQEMFDVIPKKNRLLRFKVSTDSFHAAMTNTFPRKSIVWWYHTTVNDHAITPN